MLAALVHHLGSGRVRLAVGDATAASAALVLGADPGGSGGSPPRPPLVLCCRVVTCEGATCRGLVKVG